MKPCCALLCIVAGLTGIWLSSARAEQVTYRYDAMARLIRAEYPSGLILSYT